MKIFPSLRVLATLRRIAVALERANEIERSKLAKPKTPKLLEISVPSAEDWNSRWRAEHPEEDAG